MAAVVVKKVGEKRYVYLAFRRGKRTVHRYLGPLTDPEVAKAVRMFEEQKRVPERFAYLFWDAPVASIDLRKNSSYVIERVLEFGDLSAFAWIESIYPSGRIAETALYSRRISRKTRNFWKVWYGFDDAS